MTDKRKYLLGLDAGNTVIKAVLFDIEGRQLAVCAQDGHSAAPAPGHVERSLEELWQHAGIVIRDCLAQADIKGDEIAAIGCAGHGNGLYALDLEGQPLAGIQSLDSRAAEISGEINAANGKALHRMTLQKPWPAQTPALLARIKRYQPELYSRIGTVFLCKDFVTFKLTGRKVSDVSDMSGCALLRMPELEYGTDVLELYGLEDAAGKLPELVLPTDVVGGVTAAAAEFTGLAEGTPVVGGLFDVVASALGSGAVEMGQASIICGSWSINQVLSERPVESEDVFMVTGFRGDRFVNMEASATSAANLEWYVREFVERGDHHDDPFGYCNALVEAVQPAVDDPFYLPFLYGSGQGAEYRAEFHGLANWHREGHVLRAIFEGIAFEHKRHINRLVAAGVSFDEAILSGGGARSPVWPQMFADILGIPVVVSNAEETGALGAAMSAAVGIGLFSRYREAAEAMTSVKRTYEPDGDRIDHYRRRYAHFIKLQDVLRPLWTELNS